jgi:hypothetical protein
MPAIIEQEKTLLSREISIAAPLMDVGFTKIEKRQP